MASNLPLEVIELIIEIVANNDYHEAPIQPKFPNTKACSLISHAFLHRCRQHIFRSIRLYDKRRAANSSWQNSAQLFAQLITDNAEIANYVRQLHYLVQTHITEPYYGVPPALARLINLETLTLSSTSGFFKWDTIKLPSMSTLLHLLHGPKIQSLKLICVSGFRVSDLVRCRNLRNLDLCHVLLAAAEDDVVFFIPPSSTTPLHHLGLKHCQTHHASQVVTRQLVDGRRIIKTNSLKSLSIGISYPREVEHATEIFQHIRGLETLDILGAFSLMADDGKQLFIDRYPVVALTANLTESVISFISLTLETLSNLKITLNKRDDSQEPLTHICHILHHISGRNCIKSLDIFIRIPKHLDCTVGDEWGELERVLLSPGWPFLVQLDIKIIANGAREGLRLEKALRKLPEIQLQGLASSKKIAFNFSADEGLPG